VAAVLLQPRVFKHQISIRHPGAGRPLKLFRRTLARSSQMRNFLLDVSAETSFTASSLLRRRVPRSPVRRCQPTGGVPGPRRIMDIAGGSGRGVIRKVHELFHFQQLIESGRRATRALRLTNVEPGH
jgi:hypothetical protein